MKYNKNSLKTNNLFNNDNVFFYNYKKQIKLHFTLKHPKKNYNYHLYHDAYYDIHFFGNYDEFINSNIDKNKLLKKSDLLNNNTNNFFIYPLSNFSEITKKEENYYSPNASKYLKQNLFYKYIGKDNDAKNYSLFRKDVPIYYLNGNYIYFDNYFTIDGIDKSIDKLLLQIMEFRINNNLIDENDYNDNDYLLLKKLKDYNQKIKQDEINEKIKKMDIICDHKHLNPTYIYCLEFPIKLFNKNLTKFANFLCNINVRSCDKEIDIFLENNKLFTIKELLNLNNISLNNTILICELYKLHYTYVVDDDFLLNYSIIYDYNAEKYNFPEIPESLKSKLINILNNDDYNNLINNHKNKDNILFTDINIQNYEKKDDYSINLTTNENSIYDNMTYDNITQTDNNNEILQILTLLKDNNLNYYEIDIEKFKFTQKIITNDSIFKSLKEWTYDNIVFKLFLDYNQNEKEAIFEIEKAIQIFAIINNNCYSFNALKKINIKTTYTELISFINKSRNFKITNLNPIITDVYITFEELIKIPDIYKTYDYKLSELKSYTTCIYNIDLQDKYININKSDIIDILDENIYNLSTGFINKNIILINNIDKDKNVSFSDDNIIPESPFIKISNISNFNDNNLSNNSEIESITNLVKSKYEHLKKDDTTSQPVKSMNIDPNTHSEPVSFKEVMDIIQESYNFNKTVESTTLDIISIYLKGQKMLFIEAKTYCEQHLYSLMLPAIFITTVCSVISGIFSTNPLVSTIVAILTAINSFILALIAYLKLDAKAEAHKMTAYSFEKIQSECEFFSGRVMFSHMDNDNKNDVNSNDIISFINKTEKKVREIREKNQFILPEKIRHKFKILYSTNIFARVKQVQNGELILINKLKFKINQVLECKKSLFNGDNTQIPQLTNYLKEQNDILIKIINYRKEYLNIGDEFDKEILDNINKDNKKIHLLRCLKN